MTVLQGLAGRLGSGDNQELELAETQLAGDNWAFERGAYNITLTPKTGGQPIRDTGKYITIYSRANDGQWLMAQDIWNSNNQPSPHN